MNNQATLQSGEKLTLTAFRLLQQDGSYDMIYIGAKDANTLTRHLQNPLKRFSFMPAKFVAITIAEVGALKERGEV